MESSRVSRNYPGAQNNVLRMRLEESDINFLQEIAGRILVAAPLPDVLARVVEFVASVAECDSCCLYLLEESELVLRAVRNPHPDTVERVKLIAGQSLSDWAAEHREAVSIAEGAWRDRRFQLFNESQQVRFESFLSVPIRSRGKLVGVINLQKRQVHRHGDYEIKLLSGIAVLVGAEVEIAHLEQRNSQLSDRLESRKLIERAKGVLQNELKISEEEAYRTMQQESKQRRISMKDISEAILLSDGMKRKFKS